MAKHAPALSNFNAGELSPDFAGRVDNEKYPVGGSALQNFIPRVQGPARRRPGFRYVTAVKDSTQRTWVRKFIFSQNQSYVIEFGVGYIRLYTNHGQVQTPTGSIADWNSGLTYNPGDLVRTGAGPIYPYYYCVASNLNQTPPNAAYWYQVGGAYEIPSPYTAAMLTNSDGTCGLHIEQSGDVVYIACGGWWPMQLTRYAATKWILSYYQPPDGPFMQGNSANSPALYATKVANSNTKYTVKSTAAMFDPSDAAGYSGTGSPGRLIRLNSQTYNTPPWTTQIAYSLGNQVRYNGNTYQCITAGTSGAAPPIQTYGVQWDGKGGAQWLYVDSGYGIAQVTTYTSSTQVTATVTSQVGRAAGTAGSQNYNLPAAVLSTSSAITAITAANPCVVTVASAAGWAVGDPVYLTGVGGMTQISEQMFIVTAIAANAVTLGNVDSTGYSAYTSGGTAIRNATLNWELGAWGIGSTAFAAQFPTTLSFYADRLFFGGGINWWGSVPGQYGSHSQDFFGQVTADCAVAGIIAAQDVDVITWMSPANILLIGTKGGEFGLAQIVSNSALGPDNVQVVRQSKWRSRSIKAEIIGTSNFYVQSSGKKVMAQDYNFYLDRYDSTNQTRLANHIGGYAVGTGIIDIAWHQEPYETLWGVRNDGVLIGYVFDRPDNVTGWHEHPLGATLAGAAAVECVCVIPAPDGVRDEAWAVVRRTIGGVSVRSVEYMEKDLETGDAQNTMCYLDMSASYIGSPTTTITGLAYLNGETVSVLRDGGGHPDCAVSGGQITLQTAGSVVQVGLACPANFITMDLEGGAAIGTAQGKIRRAVMATVRLKNTLGGYIGMAGGTLDLLQPNVSTTSLGSPPPLTTGDVRVSLPGDYNVGCKIQIQQAQPFQIELVGIFPIISIEEPSPP